MSYAAAMKAEQERLARAQKRNFEAASASAGIDDDEVDERESAWRSVFTSSTAAATDAAGDARRRKLQRKTEKRKEKQQAAEANAGRLTIYVSGIPKEVSWTAVQSLFAKAGAVRRVKLYKDEHGEPKGDGLVTFASEDAMEAAVNREEPWALFGEVLYVEAAKFDPTRSTGVPREDWARVVVLTAMFSVEEIGASGDARAFLDRLEDAIFVECLRFGPVERVQCFAADPECVASVRFESAEGAAACIAVMDGRWFNERKLGAELYDGNRKRAPDAEDDDERRARLKPPPEPEPEPEPEPPPAVPPPSAGGDDSSAPAAKRSRWDQRGGGGDGGPGSACGATADSTSAAANGSVPPADGSAALTLPSGAYVKLRGLKGAAEHNGKVGAIQGYDAASERYTIALRDGKQLALRRANLLQMLEVRRACICPSIPASRTLQNCRASSPRRASPARTRVPSHSALRCRRFA